jgi:hypothetical protein
MPNLASSAPALDDRAIFGGNSSSQAVIELHDGYSQELVYDSRRLQLGPEIDVASASTQWPSNYNRMGSAVLVFLVISYVAGLS